MSDDSARFDVRTPDVKREAEMSALRDEISALRIELNRQRDEIEYMRVLLDLMLVTPK